MKILALDLGSRTGWATTGTVWMGDDDSPVKLLRPETIESGVQEFKLERGESAGMRHLRFGRWIEDMMPLVKPGLIVYEQAYIMPTAQASEIFFGFIARVQATCALQGIQHTAVNAMRLKKWTTGSGRASKELMISTVSERWKPVSDHDEADAIALLIYAMAQLPTQE